MESATTTEIFYEIWWCRCWQVQACQVTAGIPHHNPPSALLWAREPFIRLGSQKAELTTRRAAVAVPFSNRKEKFCSFTIVVKELLVQLQPDVLHWGSIPKTMQWGTLQRSHPGRWTDREGSTTCGFYSRPQVEGEESNAKTGQKQLCLGEDTGLPRGKPFCGRNTQGITRRESLHVGHWAQYRGWTMGMQHKYWAWPAALPTTRGSWCATAVTVLSSPFWRHLQQQHAWTLVLRALPPIEKEGPTKGWKSGINSVWHEHGEHHANLRTRAI